MSYQLLLFLSVLGWGISPFFYKMANNHIHPLMVTTVAIVFYIVMTPLAFLLVKFDHTINLPGISFAVLGAVGSCVGSLCCLLAFRAGGGAGEVTAITSVHPIITMALAFCLLHEPLNLRKIVGILLAVAGCVVLGVR